MKKITYFLLASIFVLTSCQQEDEIFDASTKDDAGTDKIDICHKGKKTINISVDSIADHLAHGDKLGPCSDDPSVNYTYVPDDNFEQALIDLGYDDVLDNLVLTSNISSVTSLSIRRRNITDLTGIEDFESIVVLDFGFNQVTNLDVSNNSNLEWLYCRFNELVHLDVSNNNKLYFLVAANNNLESLNVKNGNNLNITLLHAYRNPNLDCIDVDANWFLNTTSNTNVDASTSFSENCGS